ncbi:early endosome antigen 1-like [Syngnathus typhle]|uniref:early endosome antigen 1-like n=1 Tax=Syngnathus typhle TaxID=161592 RepID=UPI002A69A294|nr:early endosome antigen 1-like [Syngnathus typhle]
MSWTNRQLLSNDNYGEHVKDLENKGTMLLEQRRHHVKEDLANLESEIFKMETEKNDLSAQTLGRLPYSNFMGETANEDLALLNLQQKEDILSEQNNLLKFNMVKFGSRTEMAMLECRCLEMETRYENMKRHFAQLEEENKDLRSHVEEKVILSGTNNLASQEWSHFGSQNVDLNSNNQGLTGDAKVIPNNNPFEQIKPLKNPIVDLKTQVKNPKEGEDILIPQNVFLKNEAAELQSQNLKIKILETENNDLRAQLQFHQEKMKTETKHFQDEDINKEVKEAQEEDLKPQLKALQEDKNCLEDNIRSLKVGLAQAQTQKDKMETRSCDLKGQVKALKEKNNQLKDEFKSLNDQVALLQSQLAKIETHNNDLRAQVKGFQENEEILIKQNESLKDEVSQLESCNMRTDKQNENLRTRVKTLKESELNLNEKVETLVGELSHLKFQRENDQNEIHRLRREVQTLRSQLQDQEELLRRIDDAESLMEKEWAEKEKLSNKLGELEEEGNFVQKQNDDVRVELEKNKCVQEQQSEQIAQLKATLQERKRQHEEATFLLFTKDDELAKQNRKIVYLNEITEELTSYVGSLKQQVEQLKVQLEVKQTDEILNNVPGGHLETVPEHKPTHENQLGLKTEVEDVNVEIKDFHLNNCSIQPKTLSKHNLALLDSPSLKLETEIEDLKTQIKDLTELNKTLNEKLAHLESWAANGDLRAEEEDLGGNQDRLTEQNHLNEKLSDLQTENGDLRVQVEDLKENEELIKQRTETLLAELEQYKTELNHLRTEAQKLRSQLHDQSDLRRRIDQAESQMEKDLAEKEKLSTKLRELEENDNSLKKQHGDVRAEMEELKSTRDQQKQQITKLKAALKQNKLKVEEARFLLDSKEDELEKLTKVTEEMKTLIMNSKQTTCHPPRLLELSQMDEEHGNISNVDELSEVHPTSASGRLHNQTRTFGSWLLDVAKICSIRTLIEVVVVLFLLTIFYPDNELTDFIADQFHQC